MIAFYEPKNGLIDEINYQDPEYFIQLILNYFLNFNYLFLLNPKPVNTRL